MRPADLPQFTGLRGLAALIVLFGHVSTPKDVVLNFGFLEPFAHMGGFGVDAFFVLSGFILCYVYADRFSAREFFISRFARIYPLHIATLMMMLGAYAVARNFGVIPTEASGYSFDSVILSTLLVSEWCDVVAPNPGSWSISVEFANYLIFAGVVAVMSKLGKLAPLVIVICAIFLVAIGDSSRVLRGMAEFSMGCAAFFSFRAYPIKRSLGVSGLLFIAPFLIPTLGMGIQYWHVALFFTGTVFLFAGSPSGDLFYVLCNSRPIVFLGEISYSVYLLQWFIWIGWKHILAKTPLFASHPYWMVLCATLSVIAASTVCYYAFERPARTWVRKRLVAISPGEAVPAL